MRSPNQFVATWGFIALLGQACPSATAEWEIIDLGTPGGEWESLAFALNEAGQVVGSGAEPSPSTPFPPTRSCGRVAPA